jgi:hypothetical protein
MAKLGNYFDEKKFLSLDECKQLSTEGFVSKYGFYKKYEEIKVCEILNETEVIKEKPNFAEAIVEGFICFAFDDFGLCNLGFEGHPHKEYSIDASKVNVDLIGNYPQWIDFSDFEKELFTKKQVARKKEIENFTKELDTNRDSVDFIKKEIQTENPKLYCEDDFLPMQVSFELWVSGWATKVGWGYYTTNDGNNKLVLMILHNENPMKKMSTSKEGYSFRSYAFLKSEFPELVLEGLSKYRCNSTPINDLKPIISEAMEQIRMLKRESDVYVIGNERIENLTDEELKTESMKRIKRTFAWIGGNPGKWIKLEIEYNEEMNSKVCALSRYMRSTSDNDLFLPVAGDWSDDFINNAYDGISEGYQVADKIEADNTNVGLAMRWAMTNKARHEWCMNYGNKPTSNKNQPLFNDGEEVVFSDGYCKLTFDGVLYWVEEEAAYLFKLFRRFVISTSNNIGLKIPDLTTEVGNNIISTGKLESLEQIIIMSDYSDVEPEPKELFKCLFFQAEGNTYSSKLLQVNKRSVQLLGILQDYIANVVDTMAMDVLGYRSHHKNMELLDIVSDGNTEAIESYLSGLIVNMSKVKYLCNGLTDFYKPLHKDTISKSSAEVKIYDIDVYLKVYEEFFEKKDDEVETLDEKQNDNTEVAGEGIKKLYVNEDTVIENDKSEIVVEQNLAKSEPLSELEWEEIKPYNTLEHEAGMDEVTLSMDDEANVKEEVKLEEKFKIREEDFSPPIEGSLPENEVVNIDAVIEIDEGEVESIVNYEEPDDMEETEITEQDLIDNIYSGYSLTGVNSKMESLLKNIPEKVFDMVFINASELGLNKNLSGLFLEFIDRVLKTSKSVIWFDSESPVMNEGNIFSVNDLIREVQGLTVNCKIKIYKKTKAFNGMTVKEQNALWICKGIPASKTRLSNKGLDSILDSSPKNYVGVNELSLRATILLIEELSQKGDLIASIFDNEGTVAKACTKTNRSYTLINNSNNESYINNRLYNEDYKEDDEDDRFLDKFGQGSLF